VAKLSEQVTAQTAQVQHLASQITERGVSLDTVTAECLAKVREARASAEATIQGTTDAMTQQIAAAQVEATERLQGIAKIRSDAEAAHASALAVMAGEKATMVADIAALEKKLSALRTTAQKFADALKD
jgi:uncharacterized protein involved in exopolysaccharide biosynthesis